MDLISNLLNERFLEPPEPKEIATCDCCGMEIYEGEMCVSVTNGMWFCSDCASYGRAEMEVETDD